MLAALPIPLPADDVIKRVADLISLAVNERNRFGAEMHLARKHFDRDSVAFEAKRLCADRIRRSMVWNGELPTLTAWTYASTGGATAFLLGEWKRRLCDVLQVDGIFKGGRNVRIPCRLPHGVELFSQRDVFMRRPVPKRIVRPPVDDRLLLSPPEALLVASRGQYTEGNLFARVEHSGHIPSTSAITEDILRLLPQREHVSLAYAYLSSELGYALLRSTAFGTSIPGMRQDLVQQLPYPDLKPELARAVKGHIDTAIQARKRADVAEREAMRLVEEEVLPAWLT
jgi:hypothetical protein